MELAIGFGVDEMKRYKIILLVIFWSLVAYVIFNYKKLDDVEFNIIFATLVAIASVDVYELLRSKWISMQ